MTIERIHYPGCGKPIRQGSRHKNFCQCKGGQDDMARPNRMADGTNNMVGGKRSTMATVRSDDTKRPDRNRNSNHI